MSDTIEQLIKLHNEFWEKQNEWSRLIQERKEHRE